MKPKKDIFDLFRNSEHKLSERPSRDAWSRLENRLDDHKSKNRRSALKILSYAAAVLVLVVSVSLMTTMFQSSENTPAENISASFEVEDIMVVNVSRDNYEKAQDYQRNYKDQLTNPIAEGKASKKLIANFNLERRDGNLQNFYEKKRRESEQNLAQAERAPEKEKHNNIALNQTTSVEMEEETPEEKEVLALPESTVATMADNDAKAESKDASPSEDQATTQSAPATTPTSKEVQEAFMRGESINQAKSKTKSSASKTTVSMAQFQWLLGSRERSLDSKTILENWIQTDQNTLTGSGLLLADDSTVFNGSMTIQRTENGIYLIADIDGSAKEARFRLVSNEAGNAVFENESDGLPKQVILKID